MRKIFFRHRSKGFTLIELRVVIAIIGILASIITGSLASARARGRDAKRVADIKNIELALKLYYADNLKYPNLLTVLVTNNYLSQIPKDPLSPSRDYRYIGSPAGPTCTSFHLGAVLEANSAVLNDDADAVAASGVCNSSLSPDFSGLSVGSGSPVACDTVAGTGQPGGTELCYDVKP